MKHINLQRAFRIPEGVTYIAHNQDGSLVGFNNPPIRDYERKIWIDSATGEAGVLVTFDRWDTSLRMVADLADLSKWYEGRKIKALKNMKEYKAKMQNSQNT